MLWLLLLALLVVAKRHAKTEAPTFASPTSASSPTVPAPTLSAADDKLLAAAYYEMAAIDYSYGQRGTKQQRKSDIYHAKLEEAAAKEYVAAALE